MQTEEMLEELLKKAKVDMSLRQKLFETRNEKNPVSAFCKTCKWWRRKFSNAGG